MILDVYWHEYATSRFIILERLEFVYWIISMKEERRLTSKPHLFRLHGLLRELTLQQSPVYCIVHDRILMACGTSRQESIT